MQRIARILLIGAGLVLSQAGLRAQSSGIGAPVIAAASKGPNQINLTWPAVSNPGYGYLVEVQSAADSRYTAWHELRPVPAATGYTCDNTITIRGGHCNISDPSGAHVYNPSNNGIPYWVTEKNYIDPQDGSSAQFIAAGLKPNTSYSFRVRTYSGFANPVFGTYSNTTTVTTANYLARYVSPSGNDANDGTTADNGHAWRTLYHASGTIVCGQVLIVKGGNYANDLIRLVQSCSAASKAVVLVNPGERAVITSTSGDHTMVVGGSYTAIDGMVSASSSAQSGDYDIFVNGSHNAILNVETHPAVVPMAKGGATIEGDHNLLYGSYLHDALSPDATQNPQGNGGFVLTLQGVSALYNVIWSNHLTRGGHDVSLCINGCSYNRWLNNIMDGGWGMGWEAIGGSQYNLVEGSFVKDVGQLVAFYKPSFEVSSAHNVLRRNVVVNSKSAALEVSTLQPGDTTTGALIYNNVFYNPGYCYFQSSAGGVGTYGNITYSNNICYKFLGNATDIYLGNQTGQISYNDILGTDASGNAQPNRPVIVWKHGAGGNFQYPKTIADADANYSPVFSHNHSLNVNPQFADEARLDFHLIAGSPLIDAGTSIADNTWGAVAGPVDVGAYNLHYQSATQPGPSGTATFLKSDTTTLGDWKTAYGSDGFNVIGDLTSLPPYASVTASSNSPWVWASSATDARALRKPSAPSDRLAACWYSATSFALDLHFTDQKVHQVALYFLDWDRKGRIDRVDIVGANNTVLDTRTISNFGGGQYWVWNLGGTVTVRITTASSYNAVLNGIFFGGGTGVSASATFVKTDSTTLGTWKGTYGTHGYNVINDSASLPAYATMTASGNLPWTWAASSTDPRALQKASAPTDRLAACWYSPTTFSLDFHFTDQQSHQVALYFLDWDHPGRSERVDVLDENNTVLDTRAISNFGGGQYWVWNLSGHVTFRITTTSRYNAVVNGIFF